MKSPSKHKPACARAARALIVALVLACSLAAARAAAAAPADDPWTARAVASYDALQRYLYLGPRGNFMYLEAYPLQAGDNSYSYLFPLREATAATIDMAGIDTRYEGDVQARFRALQGYWDSSRTPPAYDSYPPPPLGSAGDPFYDDNDIVALELIRQYLATGDSVMLQRAEATFRFIATGWDTDTTRPCPGGEHWVAASWNPYRAATNATGLGAEVAAHLYEATHDPQYLDWATRMYDWNHTCMRSPEGLYWNGIRFDGTIETTFWIYNSGAMIGAGALLYRATGDAVYLQQAQQDAAAAIAYWTPTNGYFDQPAVFDAIFFKNLLLLDSLAPDPAYRRVIEVYAEHVWAANRDPATGLFKFQPSGGGAYDPSARPETLEQSAVVQIFAVLAWSPSEYWRIA
jgi:hypothetical protein